MIGNGKTNNKPWNYCFKQQVTGSFWSMVGPCRSGYESKGPVWTGRNGSCNPPCAVKHTGQNLRLSESAMSNPWSNLSMTYFCSATLDFDDICEKIAGHIRIWWGKNMVAWCMLFHVNFPWKTCRAEVLAEWFPAKVLGTASRSWKVTDRWVYGSVLCRNTSGVNVAMASWIFSDTNYVGFDRTI